MQTKPADLAGLVAGAVLVLALTVGGAVRPPPAPADPPGAERLRRECEARAAAEAEAAELRAVLLGRRAEADAARRGQARVEPPAAADMIPATELPTGGVIGVRSKP